jgi:hypothetical protein
MNNQSWMQGGTLVKTTAQYAGDCNCGNARQIFHDNVAGFEVLELDRKVLEGELFVLVG